MNTNELVQGTEYNRVKDLADERAQSIINLNRQLDKLEAVYNDEQKRMEVLEAQKAKLDADNKKYTSSYAKMKDSYAELKEQKEELEDKCEVLEEEYEIMKQREEQA